MVTISSDKWDATFNLEEGALDNVDSLNFICPEACFPQDHYGC